MSAFYTPIFERGWVKKMKEEIERERRKKDELQYEAIPDDIEDD